MYFLKYITSNMKSYDNEIKTDFDREVLQPEKTQCLIYSLLLQQERKQIHNFKFFFVNFFLTVLVLYFLS